MGLASKRTADGVMRTYVVARYFPAGNTKGQFAEEVGNFKCKDRVNVEDL